MSDKIKKSDLVAELCTEEQQLLSGGQYGMGRYPGSSYQGGDGYPGSSYQGGDGYPGGGYQGGDGYPGGSYQGRKRYPTYICRPIYGYGY
jgi:uncharacterized membrane protein